MSRTLRRTLVTIWAVAMTAGLGWLLALAVDTGMMHAWHW